MIRYARLLVLVRIIPALDRIHAEARAIRNDSIKENDQIETEVRQDTYSEKVEMIFQALRSSFQNQYSDAELKKMATRYATNVSDGSRRDLTRVLSNALSVNVFFSEPYLKSEIDHFVKSNVDLIKTVSSNYFSDIEQTVMRGIQNGTRVDELTKDIAERFKPSENHARLIARDQIGKFNGNLNKLRQKEVGISKYFWSSSNDERVRGNPDGIYPKADPSHYEYQRQDNGWGPGVFSWDDPPEDGHPGEAIQCRCQAIPIFDMSDITE